MSEKWNTQSQRKVQCRSWNQHVCCFWPLNDFYDKSFVKVEENLLANHSSPSRQHACVLQYTQLMFPCCYLLSPSGVPSRIHHVWLASSSLHLAAADGSDRRNWTLLIWFAMAAGLIGAPYCVTSVWSVCPRSVKRDLRVSFSQTVEASH